MNNSIYRSTTIPCTTIRQAVQFCSNFRRSQMVWKFSIEVSPTEQVSVHCRSESTSPATTLSKVGFQARYLAVGCFPSYFFGPPTQPGSCSWQGTVSSVLAEDYITAESVVDRYSLSHQLTLLAYQSLSRSPTTELPLEGLALVNTALHCIRQGLQQWRETAHKKSS
jgi:hypothetical protein